MSARKNQRGQRDLFRESRKTNHADPFDSAEFPWFKKATIEQMTKIEWPTPNHLYWPLIDVDLSVESIRNPGKFPLQSK